MMETLEQASDPFPRPTYLPRITRRDGRAVEEALAGPTLCDAGVRLDAAVVEATYAVEDPPLLKRLRESRVPQLVDPQTLRFTGERFLTVAQFERLISYTNNYAMRARSAPLFAVPSRNSVLMSPSSTTSIDGLPYSLARARCPQQPEHTDSITLKHDGSPSRTVLEP
jgi:hypothetical protein